MRYALIALLLSAPFAPSAPVKANLKGDPNKLDAIWKELESTDTVVRMRATFELIEHPKAIEFLEKKYDP